MLTGHSSFVIENPTTDRSTYVYTYLRSLLKHPGFLYAHTTHQAMTPTKSEGDFNEQDAVHSRNGCLGFDICRRTNQRHGISDCNRRSGTNAETRNENVDRQDGERFDSGSGAR